MKKVLIIALIIILLIVLALGGTFLYFKNWYESNLSSVNSVENGKDVKIEIEKGTGSVEIASILEKNKVIKNADVFKIYLKLNKINNLQAGKYVFNNGKDNVKTIVEKIKNGEVEDESVTITFVEGKTFNDFAKVISKNTNNSLEDVYDLIKDEEYIDSLIEKYWFITDEIKNEDIYYNLEGYLKPDTYTFEDENVSVKEIFNIILNFTDKFLSKEETKQLIQSSGLSIHQILTLASVVEKEASNKDDMPEIAGVFYNRLNNGMPLGSDVTTYYAFQIDLSESDLTSEQLNTYNPYNTRHSSMAGKLPVGPICNPSENAILAVLNPMITDNYYFVSDKNGKTYFTQNYSEHTELVKELKEKGLWYTY